MILGWCRPWRVWVINFLTHMNKNKWGWGEKTLFDFSKMAPEINLIRLTQAWIISSNLNQVSCGTFAALHIQLVRVLCKSEPFLHHPLFDPPTPSFLVYRSKMRNVWSRNNVINQCQHQKMSRPNNKTNSIKCIVFSNITWPSWNKWSYI